MRVLSQFMCTRMCCLHSRKSKPYREYVNTTEVYVIRVLHRDCLSTQLYLHLYTKTETQDTRELGLQT